MKMNKFGIVVLTVLVIIIIGCNTLRTPTSAVPLTPTVARPVAFTFTYTATVLPTGSKTVIDTVTLIYTETLIDTSTPTPTETAPEDTMTPTSISTLTKSPTFTYTVLPSATFADTATYTVTITGTLTVTKTGTITMTHTVSPTFTPWAGSDTDTPTVTITPSITPSKTTSSTPSITPSVTVSTTSSATPTYTDTLTATLSVTLTASRTVTLTRTVTATYSRTATSTATRTVTATATATAGWKSKACGSCTFQYMVVDSGMNMDAILTCTATGWVAVMWHSNTSVTNMKGEGGNIIIGYVTTAGVANLYDFYNAVGAGDTAHYDDTNAARYNPPGTNDIISFTGTQVGSITEFRFKYPLNTGDSHDVPLVVGNNYNFSFAWASQDNTTSQHTNYCVIRNTPF